MIGQDRIRRAFQKRFLDDFYFFPFEDKEI